MDCKTAEKNIPKFINNELDDYELEEFLNHTENCEQCKEELSIQFLVSVGMMRLEEGGTFDLGGELSGKISLGKNRIGKNQKRNKFFLTAELIFVFTVLMFSIFFLY